jgi:hypothetical protein
MCCVPYDDNTAIRARPVLKRSGLEETRTNSMGNQILTSDRDIWRKPHLVGWFLLPDLRNVPRPAFNEFVCHNLSFGFTVRF